MKAFYRMWQRAKARRLWMVDPVVVGLALLTAAACGDVVTAPEAQGTRNLPAAARSSVAPFVFTVSPFGASQFEDIVVTRTQDIVRTDAKGKQTRESQRTTRTLRMGTTAVSHGATPPIALQGQGTSLQGKNISDRSLPPLHDKATRGKANRGRWKTTTPLGDSAGTVAEMEGNGDEPASDLRLVRDRRILLRVQRKWQRTAQGEYELLREETSTEDGRFREVVTADHRGHGASASLSVDPFLRQAPTSLSTRLTPRGPALNESCDDGSSAPDPCQDQVDNEKTAGEALMLMTALMYTACLVPEPAQPLACVSAIAAYALASRAMDRAVEATQRCRAAHPPKPPCTCGGATSRGTSDGLGGLSLALMPRSTPSQDFGCNDPPPGGGTGGGGTGGGGSTTCVYDVLYDTETGDILSSTLLYCYAT